MWWCSPFFTTPPSSWSSGPSTYTRILKIIKGREIVDGLSFNQLAFEWYQSDQQLEKKVEEILEKFDSLEKNENLDNTMSAKNCEIDLT